MSTNALRSARLQKACTTCSTTPRTGRARVEELSCNGGSLEEHLYEEAKLCLNRGNVKDALMLFRQCSITLRNTAHYIAKCIQHQSMCKDGILYRPECEPWRVALAEALGMAPRSMAVARYAELLYEEGFSPAHLRNLRFIDPMMTCTGMSPGHAAALEEYAGAAMEWHDRWMAQTQRAVMRCNVDAVVREVRPWISTPPESSTPPA